MVFQPTHPWRCWSAISSGSIPFGLVLTYAAGLGDVRKIGSGQHRRHQRAAHRHKGARRRHAAARPAEGHGSRAADRRLGRAALSCAFDAYQLAYLGRARRVPRPSLPGLAQLRGRQGRRHLHRRAVGRALAGGAGRSGLVWIAVALRHALFLAGSPVRPPSPSFSTTRSPAGRACLLILIMAAPDFRSSTMPTSAACWPARRARLAPSRQPSAASSWRVPDAADAGAAAAGAARCRPAPGLPATDPQRATSGPSPSASSSITSAGPEPALGGSARAVARAAGGSRCRICPRGDAEAELEAADRIGARPLFTIEPGYPPALAAVDAPPPLLYVKGDVGHLARPMRGHRRRAQRLGRRPEARPHVRRAHRQRRLRHRLRARPRHRRGARTRLRWTPAPLPCWPAASTTSIRRSTTELQRPDRRARLPGQRERRPVSCRAPGTSRAATASSPASPWAC